MIYPIIPTDKLPVILTLDGRVIVARYVQTAPHEYTTQYAVNWPALEDDARQSVHDMIGAIVDGETFPCPEELAARAVWPE